MIKILLARGRWHASVDAKQRSASILTLVPNINQPYMATLRDIMRFTMPSSSRLLTGDDGLYAHVRTVVGLRATLPAFPDLRGGELTLISPAQALALDESLTLPTIITRLGEVPVAAIAVVGPPDAAAQVRAVAANVPLIELPAKVDLRSLERDINRLIGDPDLQIERWASQLYSELTQRILSGSGISGVLRLLVERTGRSVACYSASGKLRAQQMHEVGRAVFEILRPEATGELTSGHRSTSSRSATLAGWRWRERSSIRATDWRRVRVRRRLRSNSQRNRPSRMPKRACAAIWYEPSSAARPSMPNRSTTRPSNLATSSTSRMSPS